MRKALYVIAAVFLCVMLYACGGGGGGGGSAATGSPVLLSSLVGVSASTMTVGDAASASGSTQLVLLEKIRTFFNSLSNPLISTAYAQSVTSCSSGKQLIGSQDARTWSVMGLTAVASSSCVISYQDAGNYIVLATKGVTDSSGNVCDMVVVTKSSGATTCINLALPERANTGNPVFLLGTKAYSWNVAQLTNNGNYFLVGFNTKNTSAAYVGYARIDFTGNTPVAKIAYLEYGTQGVSDCDGTMSVNGHNILWTTGYWLQENGNFIFNQLNVTQCSGSLANFAAGTSKYYYVDVNNTVDPLNPVMYLFDQHNVPASIAGPDPQGPYMIDNVNSPLGSWIVGTLVPSNSSYVTWQNTVGTVWDWGGEVFPGGSTSPTDLSFYIVVGNSQGSMPNACATTGTSVYGVNTGVAGNELIKVTINNGRVSFQDYGATNIGTGWGALPTTDNVYLSNDGRTLSSLHWVADGNNNLKALKIARPLGVNACDAYTMVAPASNIQVPASVAGNISTLSSGGGSQFFNSNQLPYTYRAKDYIYMYSFGSAGWQLNCSASVNGCQIPADAQVWAYNKTNDTVSVVSIGALTGATTYYSTSTNSNPLSNKVSNTLVDGAAGKYWYSLSPAGVTKMIELSSGFDASYGFASGTN